MLCLKRNGRINPLGSKIKIKKLSKKKSFSFSLQQLKKKKMCDPLNRPTCAKASIGTNVVPAWDEHYRGNESLVPNGYQNACEMEGCGANPMPNAECNPGIVEQFTPHHSGGRRYWRNRYGYGGGYPWWGYYSYPQVVETRVIENPTNRGPWLFLFFIAIIILLVILIMRK